MGGWKTKIQVRDLVDAQRLEMTCRRCGYVYYLTAPMILREPDSAQLYLDEVEARARCRMRGCSGSVRLSMPNSAGGGFVGGLA